MVGKNVGPLKCQAQNKGPFPLSDPAIFPHAHKKLATVATIVTIVVVVAVSVAIFAVVYQKEASFMWFLRT